MKAIILNAGKGARLAPVTNSAPKCLTDVGGRPIFSHQLDAIVTEGIQNVVVVVGYRKEDVINYAIRHYPQVDFTFVENIEFGSTNTAYSLLLTRREIDDEILYLNGDVLLDSDLLHRILGSPHKNALAVRLGPCGREEVKVITAGDRILAIGKELSTAQAAGEFLGVARFSQETAWNLMTALQYVVHREQRVKAYFEEGLDRIAQGVPLEMVDASELPCIEIDFPEDLERAQRECLPRLRREVVSA